MSGDITMEDRHGIEPDDELKALDAEPSLDGLMAQLSSMLGGTDEGWAGIEDKSAGNVLERRKGEVRDRIRKEALVFRDTFMTPGGRQCLEIMLDQTLRRPVLPPFSGLPLEALTALSIARDAENAFVWAILEAIAQAENNPLPAREF